MSRFFNDTATTEIYTLSLHDALPILKSVALFVFFQNNKNRKLSPTAVISRLRGTSLSLSATAKFMSFVNTVTVTVCAMFIGSFRQKAMG